MTDKPHMVRTEIEKKKNFREKFLLKLLHVMYDDVVPFNFKSAQHTIQKKAKNASIVRCDWKKNSSWVNVASKSRLVLVN